MVGQHHPLNVHEFEQILAGKEGQGSLECFSPWGLKEQDTIQWLNNNKGFPGGGGLVVKSCPTLATPWTLAHQASLSMGFSRQEYWSGLPYPPPGDLPNPEIKPRSPALQAHSLPAEPPGKPKNTGVGSRSLLQQIFLTQESNQGLLHYRWTLLPAELSGKSFP